MWIKRAQEEIEHMRGGRRRHRRNTAILLGLLTIAIHVFFFGGAEWPHLGRFFVTLREMPSRLALGCLLGVVFGAFYYFCPGKPTVVCPKCGATKYGNQSEGCSCGGQFERIEEMRWE